MSSPKSTESIFPPPLEFGEVKNLWIMHLKVSNTATFKKLSFYQFPSSLWTYFLKGKTPSVIPLWRPFLMPMKGARSKVPRSGHFRWLSQCQDWITKSGGHMRSLKLETWNFAWDLISPIHMLCKNIGLIWEHFEKMVQPNTQGIWVWFSRKKWPNFSFITDSFPTLIDGSSSNMEFSIKILCMVLSMKLWTCPSR